MPLPKAARGNTVVNQAFPVTLTSSASNKPTAPNFWTAPTTGIAYTPYNANVMWQETNSSATYSSAGAALKAPAR